MPLRFADACRFFDRLPESDRRVLTALLQIQIARNSLNSSAACPNQPPDAPHQRTASRKLCNEFRSRDIAFAAFCLEKHKWT
jgi:hypothetical protein